jgi:hypothetical protein
MQNFVEVATRQATLSWHQETLHNQNSDIIAVYNESPSQVNQLVKCSKLFRAIAGVQHDVWHRSSDWLDLPYVTG